MRAALWAPAQSLEHILRVQAAERCVKGQAGGRSGREFDAVGALDAEIEFLAESDLDGG
jgi:hypothetical protein